MEIRKVGVLGCGLMGAGIAQVSAAAGFETYIREVEDEPLDRGMASIRKTLAGAVERDRLTEEERQGIESRLQPTTELGVLEDCDIVIEAVTENLELKQAVWREVDVAVSTNAIFASNTSSLTIAAMAGATKRSDRFVGMHFFYPVPAMKLVEVVRTVTTSDEAYDRAHEFVLAIGKDPIAAKDQSGFTVNLLLVPYLLDAIRSLERGVASVADIDKGMQLGCGYPMGPFTLCDFLGLDTVVRVARTMYEEHLDPKYAPPALLKRMVLVGMTGKKSGKGFYDYSTDPPAVSELGI